jgi:hypothetical protein
MKKFFQQRWVWFLLGLLCLPCLSFLLGLFGPPSAKEAMPFNAVFEESRTEFYLPADYSYSLRSKGSVDEFRQFVKKMKMEDFRVANDHYEKKSSDGQHQIEIFYEDGWITYREVQT